ncbi:MAG: hypothetical protein AB7V42_14400 [Thermoleophilia bacterium]
MSTRRVTYQSILGEQAEAAGGVYVRLGAGAIATRRRDAGGREVSVALSKAQRRWLREATELSGPGVDEQAVLRAMVDLGMELEIDWAVLANGRSLRQAVRESVMVRRRPAAG